MCRTAVQRVIDPVGPHRLTGKVVEGFKRGPKQLGWPTANLDPAAFESRFDASTEGVYVGWAAIRDPTLPEEAQAVHKAVLSMGWNPTYTDVKQRTVVRRARLGHPDRGARDCLPLSPSLAGGVPVPRLLRPRLLRGRDAADDLRLFAVQRQVRLLRRADPGALCLHGPTCCVLSDEMRPHLSPRHRPSLTTSSLGRGRSTAQSLRCSSGTHSSAAIPRPGEPTGT